MTALIPGVGTHEPLDPFRVFLDVIHTVDVRMNNCVIIVNGLVQRNLVPHSHRLGPAAPAYQKRKSVNVEPGFAVEFLRLGKERVQADFSGGFPRLEQAHGAHGEPSEAPGAGMGDFLCVRRHGRTGQHKLPQFSPVVNFKPDGIPQLGCQLPFVNQPGRFPSQKPLGTQLGHGDVLLFCFRVVHVEDAFGNLLRCGGLSAPLRPFNQHGPFAFQLPFQNFIGNSFPIPLHWAHLISACLSILYPDCL